MGKMSLTSCRALSTPGKFSNVDRYVKSSVLPNSGAHCTNRPSREESVGLIFLSHVVQV